MSGGWAEPAPLDCIRSVSGERDNLLAVIDSLVDSAPKPLDLVDHRLEVFAARRFRALGLPVPEEFQGAEQRSVLTSLAMPGLLRRVRSLYDGPVILLKGPEVASYYPEPHLRPYKDLDLLVHDPEECERALLRAGFRHVGDPTLYVDIHHLRPLWWPEAPLTIELHSEPKWVDGLEPPSFAALLETSRPARVGVEGIQALDPARHALALAAHSWAHEPLRRLRDLIDIHVVAAAAPPDELARIAREWGAQRLWATTSAAIDDVIGGGRDCWALRVWARNLEAVRARTVLESHLEHWFAGFWALPPGAACVQMVSSAARELRPAPGETAREKRERTQRAFRNAFVRRVEHDQLLAHRRHQESEEDPR